jgi:hypothetical protein
MRVKAIIHEDQGGGVWRRSPRFRDGRGKATPWTYRSRCLAEVRAGTLLSVDGRHHIDGKSATYID